MAELEIIKGTDIASEAIKKLDRNIKAVNLEVEEGGGGGGSDIELVDNLNEENPGKALDARQGKALDDKITAINTRTQISIYTTLPQLGFTDEEFDGLTQVQAFDLLLTKMTPYKVFEARTDNSIAKFRTAIGSLPYGNIIRIEVFIANRYVATIYGSDGAVALAQCNGYPGFCTGWKQYLQVVKGTGSPEGNVTGNVGDIYINTSGGANTTLYIKTSGTGNTGWTAK